MPRVECAELDEEQKRQFRRAVVDGELDPVEVCPFCGRKPSTVDEYQRWNEATQDFTDLFWSVRCARCRLAWGVRGAVLS